MSLYAFHLGQIISTVLGQVDHGGQDGNAARTRIRDETSETDHTQKRRFRHAAIYRTIKALAILMRCLYGSEIDRILLLISSSITLLTLPSSLFDGLISRHFGCESKLSLWSFKDTKAFLVAIVSTRSPIEILLLIFWSSELISSVKFLLSNLWWPTSAMHETQFHNTKFNFTTQNSILLHKT